MEIGAVAGPMEITWSHHREKVLGTVFLFLADRRAADLLVCAGSSLVVSE